MRFRRILTIMLLPLAGMAAEAPLMLDEAVRLALARSKGAQLAQLKVDEAGLGVKAAREQRYPHISVAGLAGRYSEPLDVKLRAGSLTTLLDGVGTNLGLGPLSPTLGQFPANDLTLLKGERYQYFGGVTVLQPLTQQWRIGSGLAAATATQTEAQREATWTDIQIRTSVEQLFAALLLEESRRVALAARVEFVGGRLRDAENGHAVGELLDDAVLGLQAELTQAKSELVHNGQKRAQLSLQLADLIGRPGVDDLVPAPELPARAEQSLSVWLAKAAQNPERLVAEATAEKARAGVRAAKQGRIPDVSLFAAGYWQEGQALVPNRGGVAGVALNWDVFDFGRRGTEISRGLIRLRQAETNRDRLAEDAAREIRTAWQDYTYAGELVTLAQQAQFYRRRSAELAKQSVGNGLDLATKALGADADLRKADADLRGAHIQQHLALLRLYALTGEL